MRNIIINLRIIKKGLNNKKIKIRYVQIKKCIS